MLSGLGPRPAFDARVGVEVARAFGPVLAPSLGLGLTLATTGREDGAAGSITFQSVMAHVEGCPVRWVVGRLAAAPCATLDVGALRAVAANAPAAHAETRPWVAVGLGARARVELVQSFAVEVAGGALFPGIRDRFFFSPSAVAYATPTVGAGATVGLHVAFR